MCEFVSRLCILSMCHFSTEPHCFHYYHFIIYLKSGNMMHPNLFFFLKIDLPVWGLCDSIQILGLFFFPVKNTIEILKGIVLNLQMVFRFCSLNSCSHLVLVSPVFLSIRSYPSHMSYSVSLVFDLLPSNQTHRHTI